MSELLDRPHKLLLTRTPQDAYILRRSLNLDPYEWMVRDIFFSKAGRTFSQIVVLIVHPTQEEITLISQLALGLPPGVSPIYIQLNPYARLPPARIATDTPSSPSTPTEPHAG